MLEITYAPGLVCVSVCMCVCVCAREIECVPQSLCVKVQTTVQMC